MISSVVGVLGLEKGLIKTFWEIIRYPHIFFDNYIKGKTKPYSNPIVFIISSIAIYLFITSITTHYKPESNYNINNASLYLSLFINIIIYSTLIYLFFKTKFKKFINYLIISTYLMSIKWLVIFILLSGQAFTSGIIERIIYHTFAIFAFSFLPIYYLIIFHKEGKIYKRVIFALICLVLYIIEENIINSVKIDLMLD